MGSHTNAADSRRVMDAIRRIVKSLRVASRDAERRLGLSGAQLFVLQKLAERQAQSINELADRTRTHQSSVSVVVHRLVDRRLVARTPAKNDARRIVLSLTEKGRTLVRQSPRAAPKRLIDSVEKLPVAKRHELAELLEKIAHDALGDSDPPPMFFEESTTQSKRKKNGSR
jgi:DNA-binding MarR family transcriptional regulator